MEDKKISIYYDGSCPMCTVFADTTASSSQGEKFERNDVTKGALPAGATFEQVWDKMYVVDSNGVQYKGADAVLRIMQEYPLWRPLAFLGRLPIFNSIAHGIYYVVSKNRHRIPWKKRGAGGGT